MTLLKHNPAHQPVTPLLVQLYDRHSLYKLAEDKSPLARQELCEIISDILALTEKPSERELIADILISLIRQAEHDLKCALSERLAVLDNAPLRLLLRLTEEAIDVAAPVLRQSKVLNDLDLMYIIQAHDSPYWQAIAARDEIPAPVADCLAQTRDRATARILAGNEGAELGASASNILADLATDDESIARPLLRRPGLPEAIARKLYQYVAEDLRTQIASQYPVESAQVADTVADVIAELAGEPQGDYRPTAAMLKAAELFGSKGQLTMPLMLGTLRRGQYQSFVAQFARYCGMPPSVILPILQQQQGQGLALLARANGISKDEFKHLFLLTRAMSRPGGTYETKDLIRALDYHDRITKELAQRLLRGCR